MSGPNINDDFLGWVEATRGLHNDHGRDDFVRLMDMRTRPQDGFTRVTVQAAANYFGVHRHTMQDWIRRYNEGHAQDSPLAPVQ